MTRFFLTTAAAALLAGASALPALAETHEDLNSMTCADFRALEEDRQMEVAAMALAELSGGGESMRDTAQATEPTDGETTEEEADDTATEGTVVDNEGTATATEGTAAPDQKTVPESDMEALFAACDRNLDANLLEAAAGMDTQK